MIIKEGFDDKETEIKINTQPNGSIEIWIRESGKGNIESLGYMNPTELVQLFKEVRRAGEDLFE